MHDVLSYALTTQTSMLPENVWQCTFSKEFDTNYDNRVLVGIDWTKVQNDGFWGIDFDPYLINAVHKEMCKPHIIEGSIYSKNIKSKKTPESYLWYLMLDTVCQCIWNGQAIIDIKKIEVDE